MKTNINRTLFSVVILLGMAGFSGCKVSQDYQRPSLTLPEQFSASPQTDTTSIAELPWNGFFTDTTLLGLIKEGIAHNYELQIALKHIEAERAEVKQAKLLGLPGLDLQVSGQSSRPSDNSLNALSTGSLLHANHIEDYNAYASLSWELDAWGKIRRQKEATMAAYLGSFEAARAVQTRLVSDIAMGYYNLLMLDEQLRIASRNLALSDSTVEVTRLEQQAGQVTLLAVQQAESQREATAVIIPRLEMDRSLQENALRILTGRLPGEVKRASLLSGMDIPDTLSTGVPARMVSRRPDVRVSELDLVSANAEVGVARAEMYPSLNITASGGVNSFKASNWFNMPASLFGLVAGTIAQPVFQRRRLKTQWEVAKVNREQDVMVFRQSVLNAVGEVSDALVRIRQLKKIQEATATRVDTLQQAVSNARLLFTSGMANYLEVITAQQNALQSELDLADVKRQRLDAVVTLYRSLGGGWK